jgi:hypothetical protein
VFRTPRPQRLLDRLLLVGVPPIESPFGIEQRLEPGIGAFTVEKACNLVVASLTGQPTRENRDPSVPIGKGRRLRSPCRRYAYFAGLP